MQNCAFLCIFRPPPRGVSGGVLGGSRGCGGAGGGDGLNSSPSFLVEVGHSSRRTERPCDQSSICSIAHKTLWPTSAATTPLATNMFRSLSRSPRQRIGSDHFFHWRTVKLIFFSIIFFSFFNIFSSSNLLFFSRRPTAGAKITRQTGLLISSCRQPPLATPVR